MLSEPLFPIYVLLFTFTSCVVLLYYRRLKEGARGYVKAKNLVDDIIFSFSRDLRKQQELTQGIVEESERASIESHEFKKGVDDRFSEISARLDDLAKTEQGLASDHEELKKKVEVISAKWDDFDKKVAEARPSQDIFAMADVSGPPVVRDRALVGLTETEMQVLGLLAPDREMTAPRIRDAIGLTREHTARLMKSLYERGYIERRTNKMPYVYRLKDEMRDILAR